MKGPLGFNADDLMQETLAMQRKLMEGLKLLPQVEDVDYGVTAREEVWRDGKVVLYRFVGEQAPTRRTPLLIVYALVNRPYMVDLQADRSLVQKLLALGQDVYVLDWGYPDRSERFQTLEDYLLRYIDGAVDALRARSGGPVDLLGICQGGVFALCYAALRRQDEEQSPGVTGMANTLARSYGVDFVTALRWLQTINPADLADALKTATEAQEA